MRLSKLTRLKRQQLEQNIVKGESDLKQNPEHKLWRLASSF
jgi:hypothetical protein